MQGPETRASLIASLNQTASREAWDEFAAIYRPLIIRVASAKGLQHADAEDLAQEVLAIVGQKIGDFDLDHGGSFRGWLGTITRNLVVNHLSRGKGPIGSGDSAVQAWLQQIPQPADPTATLFDLELRRCQFQAAAEKVRPQFSEATWDAFWLTAVKRVSIAEVAKLLDKTEGAVRMARCRVMTRLREAALRDSIEEDKKDDC
ncbi:ECF RNA polymerase sigma factor SigE [Rubripirellula tenax]|uniref:ECF RNA polymerase sigma factor SigE n=1 Tax=Rubripirellula tenax TaxID=2528015 RepID=A0A5C6FE57_9BACT|nr:ECF RNA polymerase sigma factor SigE [Rubripirellula tenax]